MVRHQAVAPLLVQQGELVHRRWLLAWTSRAGLGAASYENVSSKPVCGFCPFCSSRAAAVFVVLENRDLSLLVTTKAPVNRTFLSVEKKEPQWTETQRYACNHV
ncbi:hypothetical protein EYF80_009014 [Liparis tanakae]|uniref:Uncharacterized protein n=1 Tax=Liparis tanakae TaxID=230148 RepID=A0A4Z2IRZ2_9TELE|nr:hypothetical protein EYF80_009014 [Liparis tanakae]